MQNWLQIFEFSLDVSSIIFAVLLIILINIGFKWLPSRNQINVFLSLFLLVNISALSVVVFEHELFYRLYVLILPCILLIGPLVTNFTKSTLSFERIPLIDRKTICLFATGLSLIIAYAIVPMSIIQLPHNEQPWLLFLGVNGFVLLFALTSSIHFSQMLNSLLRGNILPLQFDPNLYKWLKGMLISMTLIWLNLLFNTISSVIEIPGEAFNFSLGLAEVLTSILTMLVLFSFTILTAVYCKKPTQVTVESENKNAGKYEKSALSESQAQSILEKLDDVMRNERYFLDNSLNVDKLAKAISSPSQYLSQAINQYHGMNFYELIANYRINHAKKLLIQEPNKNIMTIAMDSGFNTKSTFNHTFKKITGLTPSAFKKSLNANFID